jgi:hypothetical protein
MKNAFITGDVSISDTVFPVVSPTIQSEDFIGAVRVRWGISRNNYKVTPGLYGIGKPDKESNVFVTANYKLSFDVLRKNLSGVNGWILVLDTKGVNVWCAAGKGTFCTKELVNWIKQVSLEKIVTHKRLILPQLGATGVAAHKVKEETGFNVHYGPVRASDIKKFINAGYKADRAMRRVTFALTDRIKLIPNDFIYGKYYLISAMAVLFLISGLSGSGFSFKDFSGEGGPAILKVFLAYFSGVVITPLFLPYIPGRHFSLKGFFTGAAVFLVIILSDSARGNLFDLISWFFLITAISSFMAMNFTGSSTFTSLSGVRAEMKVSIPFQAAFILIGIVLQVVGKFF